MRKRGMFFLRLISGIVLTFVLISGMLYLFGRSINKGVCSSVDIHTSDKQVWQILTDFSRYPQWNPYIRQASGDIKVGAQIFIFNQSSDKDSGMAFHPAVLTVIPERELRWLGSVYVPGFFDGEHIFTIQQIDANHSHFTQCEIFSGIGTVIDAQDTNTQADFQRMNLALKARAEQR
jgi:hypothetical protein